eukprot:GEMP01040854.1.p1 GENE.GEMP01040854.1~~GEMP01040854.1.p1  ORF type:complete len:229 (+),score=36.34 GEMP01040854.1:168-854(+)
MEFDLVGCLVARGIGGNILENLHEVDFSILRIVSREISVDILDNSDFDHLWMRFYESCLHIAPSDVSIVANLRPREIFFMLTKLDLGGTWNISGHFADTGDSDSTYSYEQRFNEVSRRRSMTAIFEGSAVEDSGASFVVEGKRVGNNVVMYETIFASQGDPTPMAVNVCSAVLSLDGNKLNGVWMQHYASETRILSEAIVSGVFEGTRVEFPDNGSISRYGYRRRPAK